MGWRPGPPPPAGPNQGGRHLSTGAQLGVDPRLAKLRVQPESLWMQRMAEWPGAGARRGSNGEVGAISVRLLCVHRPGRLREGARGTIRRKGRGICKGLCSQSVTSFNLGDRGR